MEKFNLKEFAENGMVDADDDQSYIEYLNRLAETDIECHLDHDPFPLPPKKIQIFLDEIGEAQFSIEHLDNSLNAQKIRLAAAEKAFNAHRFGKEPLKRGRGKPKENVAAQVAAQRFTSMWVNSVLIQLGAKNCAELEKFILVSDERNWRRWGSGAAVPTSRLLISVITTKISKGKYKEMCLLDVPTTPPSRKLLDLINQLRRVGR